MQKRNVCEPIRNMKDVQEMLEVLRTREQGFRDALLFEVGLSTGLRISDILSLRKCDITDGFVRLKTQKTKQYRMIVLNDACREKLEAYTKNMQEEQLLFPIQRQWVHKMLKWAADQIGLDKRYVSTHVMRKTAAYHFYQRTKDIVRTQEFLGHRSSTETRKYLMINEEEVNQELQNFNWS